MTDDIKITGLKGVVSEKLDDRFLESQIAGMSSNMLNVYRNKQENDLKTLTSGKNLDNRNLIGPDLKNLNNVLDSNKIKDMGGFLPTWAAYIGYYAVPVTVGMLTSSILSGRSNTTRFLASGGAAAATVLIEGTSQLDTMSASTSNIISAMKYHEAEKNLDFAEKELARRGVKNSPDKSPQV